MDSERQQRIKERAYAIWEAEGRPHDRAEAHWQQAEQDMSAVSAPDPAMDFAADDMTPAAASTPAAAAIPPRKGKRT